MVMMVPSGRVMVSVRFGCEAEEPAVVVDLVVVLLDRREQVVEVVSPPCSHQMTWWSLVRL